MENRRHTRRLRSQSVVKEAPTPNPATGTSSDDEVVVEDRELPVLRGENKRKRGIRGAGRRFQAVVGIPPRKTTGNENGVDIFSELKIFIEAGETDEHNRGEANLSGSLRPDVQSDTDVKGVNATVKETNKKLPDFKHGPNTHDEFKATGEDDYSSVGEVLSTGAIPIDEELVVEESKAMREQGDKRRESSRLRVKPSKFREILSSSALKQKDAKGSDDVSSSLEILLPMDVQNLSAGQSVTHVDGEIDKPSETGRRQTKGTPKPSRSSETHGSGHESSSPRKGFEDNGLKAALAVVKRLMQIKSAEPFNEPVDPVVLGIPDYLDVIKEPMDLGTIRENLEAGTKYTTAQDVYEDVQLVWSNCRKYNQEGDPIMDILRTAETVFKRHWNAAGLQDYVSLANSRKTIHEQYKKVGYDEDVQLHQSEEEDAKKKKPKEKTAGKLKSVKIVQFDTPPTRMKAKRSVSVEQVMAESKAREGKIDQVEGDMTKENVTLSCAQGVVEILPADNTLLLTPDQRLLQGFTSSKRRPVKEPRQAEGQLQSEGEVIVRSSDRETSSHGSPPPSSNKRRGSPPSSKRRTFGTAHHKPDCICVVCLGRRRKLAKLALEQDDDDELGDDNLFIATTQESRSRKQSKGKSEKTEKKIDTALTAGVTPLGSDMLDSDMHVDDSSDPEPVVMITAPKVEGTPYFAASHELPLRKVSDSVLQMSHYVFSLTGGLGYQRPRPATNNRFMDAVSSLAWSDKKP